MRGSTEEEGPQDREANAGWERVSEVGRGCRAGRGGYRYPCDTQSQPINQSGQWSLA